jgi:Flp pilus assembly protein TadG
VNRTRGDEGAAAVEMALVLPLLLLITFGVIQFGYMYFAWNSMATAAGQAARHMAIHNDEDDARGLAQEVLPDELNIPDDDIQFSFSGGATSCAEDRTVTVTIVHTSPMDLLPGIDSEITRASVAECIA